MKTKYIAFSVITLFVMMGETGCNKKEDEIIPIQETVIGKWEWISSYGGFAGNTYYTPSNTGEKREMIFQQSKVTFIINDQITNIEEYIVERTKNMLFGEMADIMTVNYKYIFPDTIIYLPMRYIISIDMDTLYLDEDVYDGFGHTYVKIK